MKLKTLLAVAAAALTLAACNKQPEPAPTPETTLSVNPTSYEFKADDVNVAQEFTVTSNAAWQATAPADVDWFTVAEGNGKGNGKFKVTVTKKNEAQEARSAKVTVKADTKTVEVAVSQAAAPLPPADPTKIKTAQQFVDELLLKDHSTIASRDTTYEILNDLDFTGIEPAQYAGVFYANIDGKNHKINNWHGEGFMIQKCSSIMQNIEFADNCTCHLTANSGGMFLEANYGGKVINVINRGTVTVDDAEATTMHRGMIMGINRAYVANCKNYGKAILNTPGTKQMRFGGIFGSFAASQDPNAMEEVKGKTEIVDCENSGSITINVGAGTGMQFIGGVVAFMEATQPGQMTNCKNSGNLEVVTENAGAKVYMGGLIGARKGASCDETCSIKNCENTGNVNGGTCCTEGYFGGLLGYRYSKTASGDFTMFENCKVNCTVTSALPNEEGANPCANAGMIYGTNDSNTAKITFGSTDAPIQVAGKLICVNKEVAVTAGNLTELAVGTKSTNTNITINATLLK